MVPASGEERRGGGSAAVGVSVLVPNGAGSKGVGRRRGVVAMNSSGTYGCPSVSVSSPSSSSSSDGGSETSVSAGVVRVGGKAKREKWG